MNGDDVTRAREAVDATYRLESRRIFATLVRLLGDFDIAEEALHDAFRAALEQWPRDGVPANPRAWLVSTGRFKAIDSIRRNARFDALDDVAEPMDPATEDGLPADREGIEDDRLRLIFTCCHPALAPDAQVALTLREVCGLTTEEIARAFLTAGPTVAQRIVRAKTKIRDARIPYQVPSGDDLAQRLDAVLRVVYLVFNEGYSASSGPALTRHDLSGEAIRLGRLLVQLLQERTTPGPLRRLPTRGSQPPWGGSAPAETTTPGPLRGRPTRGSQPPWGGPAPAETTTPGPLRGRPPRGSQPPWGGPAPAEPEPEAVGLLALMLLHESRRPARTSPSGELVLLDEQDRSLWNREQIAEGSMLVRTALGSRRIGPYTLQAAIAAVHAEAAMPADTDWAQIVGLYGVLLRVEPSPVVELNRAAAVAMRDGPQAGLVLVDALLARGELAQYHLAHAARAELCRRLSRPVEARVAYERALALAQQEPERRFLQRRLAELRR